MKALGTAPAYSISKLLEIGQSNWIDILKIDIEDAERELF
jgi:hypothetical protein